ncbi:MAG: RluA family pseudouridine synthase, partial [Muribaculaceae bacterium]|nr:RluA family pseudouridine synthase [Muribaculaceae bacterium]
MNNPFDYTPDSACDEAFRKLLARIEELKKSDSEEDINFCRELDAGKMLGVLIATDRSGESHTLYAFSGQLGCAGFYYPGFVGPVFDYLDQD